MRLSVPSVAIPYGQRFIKCRLATGDKLVNLVPRGAGGWGDGTSGVGNIGGSLNYDNMLKTIELYINNILDIIQRIMISLMTRYEKYMKNIC